MKVSCIIPVYNEAERVLGVLRAVVGHPLVDEVIVVNDGSTDTSKAVLENQPGIRFFSYDENRGKSGAIAYGLVQAKNNIADYVGGHQKQEHPISVYGAARDKQTGKNRNYRALNYGDGKNYGVTVREQKFGQTLKRKYHFIDWPSLSFL